MEELEAGFSSVRLTPPGRGRRMAIAGLLAAAALGGGAYLVLRGGEEAPASAPALAPPVEIPRSADAYQVGGRPLSLGPEGDALFASLADLVIALDRHARAGGKEGSETATALATVEAKLLSPAHQRLLGEPVFAALRDLVAACRATLVDGEAVREDADRLNAALAAAGLGYYVDEDTLDHDGGTTPLLYAHAVERVQVFDVPGREPERVLWLRRLDDLNLRTNLVGSTHDGSTAAVIRLELVELVLMDYLLPALAADAHCTLWPVPASVRAPRAKFELERRCGERVRAEMAEAGLDPERSAALADLLAEREDRFSELRDVARERGYRIAEPAGTYEVDLEPYRQLAPAGGAGILRELDRIEAELRSPAMVQLRDRVRDAYLGSVEIHEVQHRLDTERKQRVPEALVAHAGAVADGAEPSAFQRRLITETSAYLAEIAAADIPFTVMLRLSRYALDDDQWDSTYSDTAVAVIAALARELGIEHGELIANRRFVREEIGGVALAMLDRSGEELRAAARAAWQRVFQAELPRPTLRQPPP